MVEGQPTLKDTVKTDQKKNRDKVLSIMAERRKTWIECMGRAEKSKACDVSLSQIGPNVRRKVQ